MTPFMNRICAALAALVMLSSAAQAQNEIDVFRHSGYTVAGTARSIGAGGAFSAVGADFSSAFLNPAGLGLYRKTEFEFTTAYRMVTNDQYFLGENATSTVGRLGFTNFGYVMTGMLADEDDESSILKSYSIGIGLNQIQNYKRNGGISGYNDRNSMTEYFASIGEGSCYCDIEGTASLAGLAWDAWLTDTSGTEDHYVGAGRGGDMQQTIRTEETGRNNEWAISGALNLKNKVYIGLTIGIRDVRYSYTMIYDEEDINNVHRSWANDSIPINVASFRNAYTTRGSGINARIGVIARPLDFLRVGVSIQTPTWHNLTDRYEYEIYSQLDGSSDTIGASGQPLGGTYAYNMVTPLRLTAGAMAMFQKIGFVSADFEITDYSAGRLASSGGIDGDGYTFQDENAAVQALMTPAYNIRIGAEARLEMLRFRAGYANFGSLVKKDQQVYTDYPGTDAINFNGGRNVYTAGFGIKADNFYLDLAFARSVTTEKTLAYTMPDPEDFSPEFVQKTKTSLFLMTLGFTL